MHSLKKIIIVALFFTFSPQILVAKPHNHPEITEINDVLKFHQKDYLKIKDRYKINIKKRELFREDQKQFINSNNLAPIIDVIFLNDRIKIKDINLLIDFAKDIQTSGFEFVQLKKRLYSYIDKDMPAFSALKKAIQKEGDMAWREEQRSGLSPFDPMVETINQLKLSRDDHNKVLKVYAVCLKPWRDEHYRSSRLEPVIGQRQNRYPAPRHAEQNISVRTSPSRKSTNQVKAYRYLTQEAAAIADEITMSVAEKVAMSKCVAEQSLTYVPPMHNPIKALNKMRQAQTHSPEHAFFGHEGVCTNFSGLLYNFGRALGLENNLFLARNGVHTYVEVEIDDEWYHSHAFNSCDLIHFAYSDSY